MNEILQQTLLYDFYGELLTEHQKDIYGQFVTEDLSLGEIAQRAGISRQGVYDIIRRCRALLEGYEEKLHLVEKFLFIKKKAEEIGILLEGFSGQDARAQDAADKIRAVTDSIIKEL